MMHKAWSSIKEVSYCFSRSNVKLQGHTAQKNHRFWPKLGVSGLLLQLEFTDGYKMMHRAWSSIVEVPYCFSRSSIKFQGHMGQNITDFDPNWAFRDYRPVAAFKSLRFALFQEICLKVPRVQNRWFSIIFYEGFFVIQDGVRWPSCICGIPRFWPM